VTGDGMVRATGYLIVKGSRYGKTAPVVSARLCGARLSRPRTLSTDEVAVRLTLVLPREAFEALTAEAAIAAVDLVHGIEVVVVEPEPDEPDDEPGAPS
jgi:hypothetical protein